jgi:succinate dehydrogenase / fumarate reductase cytochrome b subunit
MLGGVRHLIWDTGRGLDIRSVDILGWLTIVGSLALTAAVWAAGLALRGLSFTDLF